MDPFGGFGGFGAFNIMFSIFPIMFFLVFGLIIFSIGKGIKQNMYNNKQPIIPVQAKVVTKRMPGNLGGASNFFISIIPIFVLAVFNKALFFPPAFALVLSLSVATLAITLFRFKAYEKISASAVTMTFSFTPVIVAMIAIPILGESLSILQLIGGLLIVASGILVPLLKI